MSMALATRAPVACEGVGGESTLADLLAGVWEGLTAHELVPCPVCGGQMHPEYGVHARPISGRCDSCGSTLS